MIKKVDNQRGATRVEERQARSIQIPVWVWQILLAIAVGYGSFIGLQQVRWGWSVDNVDIEGEFRFWQASQLASELSWVRELNFFSLDVREVKDRLEGLPLVQTVSVKKIWPDTLLIKFKEDIPVAVWNERTLLNPHGVALSLPEGFEQGTLPRLTGPKSEAEKVMRQFQRLQRKLVSMDVRIESLSMNNVGSWQATLSNRWSVEFGRQQQEQRVSRLVTLLKILPQEKVVVVDLRYGKGAAIQWSSV